MPCSRMSWGTEGRRALGRSGQMSVEAAVLLPTVLVLIALLVQPACVLYTRSVMAATAGELSRLVVTLRASQDEVRSYALRRLSAVPEVSVFHEGGPGAWEVSVEGPGEDGRVRVGIEGRVRPLPLLGAIVSALGTSEGGLVTLRVETSSDLRASWIGGAYEEWIEMWG